MSALSEAAMVPTIIASVVAADGRHAATFVSPEIIKRIKSALALRHATASLVMEEATAEWLKRHQDGRT